MPMMVKLAVDPRYQPDPKDEAAVTAWKAAKAKGPMDMDWTTAIENVRLSKGLYTITEDVPGVPTPKMAVPRLDDLTVAELKDLMIQHGIKTEKQMKKADIVRLLRERMDVEILDDEDSE